MLYETFSDVLNLLDYFRGNLCSGLCCTCHFDVLLRFSCNVRAKYNNNNNRHKCEEVFAVKWCRLDVPRTIQSKVI